MDEYPAYSLDRNVPLLVTIGLPAGDEEEEDERWLVGEDMREQATVLRSTMPILDGELATKLRRYLTVQDPAVAPWRGRAHPPRYQFRVRTAGRKYMLPPRRSELPENFEPGPGQVVLHSPFSPLSPSCRLYADGIMNVAWIQKHQALVPSAFLLCYTLSSAEAGTTVQHQHDGQIQADITAFKAAVTQSGYRSRVAVVVLADEQSTGPGFGSAGAAADGAALVQERLEHIRRGSGVDAKLFFALSAEASGEELGRVAENMLTTMGLQALEYYRELSRHVRKKRGRGSAPQPSVPPTNGTSQTLSLPGWHIRYDFKAAVLAEFRQELDGAVRALDAAYATLLGPDVLDAIPSWSRRWNEARWLADTIAVRSLRCLLVMGQHSTAVSRWGVHRDRMCDLVETRGRGTANYGFAAWEARWALVMAGLVESTVPMLSVMGSPGSGLPLVRLPPEKGMGATAVERLPPWQRLHHSGYWHRIAAGHLYRRRALARAIPKDDRRPPGMSPASKVARLAFAYDDYMCPPPHDEFAATDHGAMVVTCLEASRAAFVQHKQMRMAAEVALECGRELVTAGRWAEAVALLGPLWTAAQYRNEGWLGAGEELAWLLRVAAAALGRADLLVSIHWELLDRSYGQRPQSQRQDGQDGQDEPYDVARTMDDVELVQKVQTVAAVRLGQPSPSFLSATFAFQTGEGKAGHTMTAQLALHSNAQPGSVAVVLDAVRVRFEGAGGDGTTIKPLLLRHDGKARPPAGSGTVFLTVVPLEEEAVEGGGEDEESDDSEDDEDKMQLCGLADLTLRPQSTVVFQVAIPLREAGDARAVSAELHYSCARYSLRQAVPFSTGLAGRLKAAWLLSPEASVLVPRPDCQAVHVLPRPPKLAIELVQAGGRAVSQVALAQVTPSTAAATAASTVTATTTTATTASAVVPFYTNEPVEVVFDLVNGEETGADVHLDAVLYGGSALAGFTLRVDGDEIDTALPHGGNGNGDGEAALRSVPLGVVAAGRRVHVSVHVTPIVLAASVDVALRAVYHLVDDPATPITQALSVRLAVTNPFEANYDLVPRRHPAAWPSLFDHEGIVGGDDETSEKDERDGEDEKAQLLPPHGLAQAWTLVTRYASFATDELRIVGLDMTVQPVAGVTCRSTRREQLRTDASSDSTQTCMHVMQPQEAAEAQFDLDVRRASLEQRDPVSLDVSLAIRWQRVGGEDDTAVSPVNVTTLPVPRLGIFGTEPRVLASVSYGSSSNNSENNKKNSLASLITLTITIENASGHFLTFGLTMEPSDEFAFAGAKLTTVHVLPVSRRTATYRLLPLVHGAWIRPTLVVRDKYFQKVLRILPTEGLKADKEGILVWVPGEE
ncbi:hypothetical protein CMQ_5452 [Grosmannia clavigera kw1407]|uniref:Trafficking protein particle complex subunit 11 domain-containing protein n=1 Tax=Grosmannia clavigera (strain kw1407 / UAMH 11150) TaxID=655863 RepID=F0XFY1_GROCL|nr:uncharacterized protein CMQ_5452 [Grosmannia clavigera kw1407]EFX03402.1 hypothetical protein CMQ_5452 [Grosmannia clavigera kw1407]